MTEQQIGLSQFREIVSSVELRDVRLVEATVKTRVRNPKEIVEPQMAVSHRARVLHRSESGFLVAATVQLQIRAKEAPEEQESPISMAVTFALTYSLADAPSRPDEILQEFARVNGAFNAWPYWREYIQSTAARMSLPPLVLPVFRVAPVPPSDVGVEPSPSPQSPRRRQGAQSSRAVRAAAKKR